MTRATDLPQTGWLALSKRELATDDLRSCASLSASQRGHIPTSSPCQRPIAMGAYSSRYLDMASRSNDCATVAVEPLQGYKSMEQCSEMGRYSALEDLLGGCRMDTCPAGQYS